MTTEAQRPAPAERRERLLAVARRVFAERGFEATTMDEIAREAGFTKPILYQFFPSKADLYHEVVAQTAARLLDSLTAAVDSVESPRTKIEVAFRVYFDMVVTETDAFRLLFTRAHEGETAAELRALEVGLVAFLEPYINIAIGDDHRRQLAAGVVGIAEGAATAWIIQQAARGWPEPPASEAQRLAARAATLAWGGLRAVQQD
jgi:AcrR family transcriptional regulator